jgi:hypothetical protein
MGATDRRVLDDLVNCGSEVKISYDTRRTHLHAKAWLSHVETPQVLRQFQTAFELYWEEGEFEAYDPAADADRVDEALTYVSHQGERPMSITWRLRHPMPAELFEEMKVAAG